MDSQTNVEKPVEENQRRSLTRTTILAIACGVIIIVFLIVFLPVYFLVIRHNQHASVNTASGNSGSSGSTGAGPSGPSGPSGTPTILTGGDGSTVTTENGTQFTYNNSFGGYWVQDSGNPFNNDARPNSWTPPLNTSWRWGIDRMYGVNLGGLFVLEPFITPELFQRYPDAKDEYTLTQAMAADTANGGLQQLEDHYNTFITEQDIAEIAGAGLNFLRVPLAFWAIETWDGEPYLAKTSWKYFLRLLGWARKYGLRVILDLHAVPGSQNGFNHSGKLGKVNFLLGNMGIANAQRALYYLRVLTEFISQPEYKDLITVFGIVNEALVADIGMDQITSFYLNAHDMIRNITGRGVGNGPYIAIHDGFQASKWQGFLPGSDRIMMDTHPYFAFGGTNLNPISVPGADGKPGGVWPLQACNTWGPRMNNSRDGFGVTIAGEFSASPNDCGFYLLGVDNDSKNPQCPDYDDWENYNDTMKAGIQNFVAASADAFGDYSFWTWKIAASQSGKIQAPLWSYQLGLRNGWIAKDPRTNVGKCQELGANDSPFDGNFKPWQTGTTSTIPAATSLEFTWPPQISSTDVPLSLLPTYTNTAPVITMPPAVFTGAPSQVTQNVDGWFNSADTDGGVTAVAGCPYPSEYSGEFTVVPTAPCTGPTS